LEVEHGVFTVYQLVPMRLNKCRLLTQAILPFRITDVSGLFARKLAPKTTLALRASLLNLVW